jgi:energy-coupling factor transporter transmembrane protein EcfT
MNPLTKIWIFIIILIGLLSLESWQSLSIYGIIFLTILFIYRRLIWPRIKGFVTFLPIMFVIYSAISIGILGNPAFTVFAQAGFITVKFGWMILVMAFYLEWGSSAKIIVALRTVWMKFNKRWEKVENGFLFLALILRFYPSFQLDWQHYTQSDKALGISPGKSLRKRIKRMINYLPGMIFAQYRRADDISHLMILRGYGKAIPRTVARPINWIWKDSSISIVFPIIFMGFHFAATI